MKNKIILGLLVFVALFTIIGCGKKEENKETLSGGWEIAKEFESYLPADAASLFYKTITEADEQVIPIVLLGKQVVAGTNYMFLVQKDGKYFVYVINEDLKKNTSIKSKKEFDLTKYTNANKEVETKVLSGGWTVEILEEDKPSMTLDENTQPIFEKATETLTGITYYPLTVLGKQVVAGTNYAVIAYGTPSTKDSVSGVYVLTLYKNLSGNGEIISSSSIDLSEYNN